LILLHAVSVDEETHLVFFGPERPDFSRLNTRVVFNKQRPLFADGRFNAVFQARQQYSFYKRGGIVRNCVHYVLERFPHFHLGVIVVRQVAVLGRFCTALLAQFEGAVLISLCLFALWADFVWEERLACVTLLLDQKWIIDCFDL
jgi:hypothetical protein